MFDKLTSTLSKLRSPTVTGIGLTESNLKMIGVILAPFLACWMVIKFFLPPELYDLYISFAFGGWLIWVVMVWAWAKSDANNFIVFPQSKWKFPNGDCRTFDLKVPADSWELMEEFEDGSKQYKVGFDATYEYVDPSLPFPRTWSMAYFLLPSTWDLSFARRAFGEFFHKGVFVTKPDCEDISVYVFDWETIGGNHFPNCIINDCALTYRQTLERAKVVKKGEKAQIKRLKGNLSELRKKADSLSQHTAYLEDRVDIAEQKSSEEFKESADNRMKADRKRVSNIMDTAPSLWQKVKNLKWLFVAIIVGILVFFAGKFFRLW